MGDNYLDSLKTTELRPGKIKLKEHTPKEQVIMESDVKALSELFVQAGEIEALSKGKLRDIQILRLGIIAELDASNLYEKLAELASNKKVKEVLLDVSREEKVHFGEFEALMETLDPEFEEAEEEGEKEVEDM